MPFPNDRRWSFDINLQVGDGVAPMTASGFAQNGGANGILDLGGNLSVTPNQQARFSGVMVVDISALKISAGNEVYQFYVVGSNTASLASGTAVLGSVQVGKGTALTVPGGGDTAAPPGTVEIFFTNNQMGSIYEYIGLYVTAAGTSPTTTFHAFVAVLPVI